MTLVACKGCQEKISAKAVTCPKCGHPNEKSAHLSGGAVLGTLVGVGFFIWWMAGGAETAATHQLDKIEATVAADMVDQYNIAKRGGDRMQICVQAGLVAAAYLQAKDEASYGTWQKTQKKDCDAAGVPM